MSHFAMFLRSTSARADAQSPGPFPQTACHSLARVFYLGMLFVISVASCQAAAPVDKQPGSSAHSQTNTRSAGSQEATGDYKWNVVTTAEGRTLIARDPSDPLNYIQASLAAYQQGKLGVAVDLLEQGSRVAEPSALLQLALGALYLELGRLADAESATLKALELEPDNLDAKVQLGRIMNQTGLHHEARSCFTQVLGIDKKHPEAQLGLAISLLEAGAVKEAERQCRLVLNEDVNRKELWIVLGESLEQQERLREAFNCYGKALAIDADLAGAHSRRGRLFCRFGQFEAAAAECRTALKLDPDDPLAHAYLSIACSRLGQKDAAAHHAHRAEEGGMQMKSVLSELE